MSYWAGTLGTAHEVNIMIYLYNSIVRSSLIKLQIMFNLTYLQRVGKDTKINTESVKNLQRSVYISMSREHSHRLLVFITVE